VIARGLPFRAVSRGTKPDDVVAAGVRKGLASDGIDVSTWRPTSVSDQDLRQAAQVISLATDLPKTNPHFKSKLLERNDLPPVSDDYNLARSAIVERVRKLLDALSPPKRLKASVEAPERSLDEEVRPTHQMPSSGPRPWRTRIDPFEVSHAPAIVPADPRGN